jgi:hypothetical protein
MRSIRQILLAVGLFATVAACLWWGAAVLRSRTGPTPEAHAALPPPFAKIPVRLTPQARKNLDLTAKPNDLTTYWRSVEFPGVIIDRPGVTDRGVVAPISGVISQVHAFPGDVLSPSAPLFTVRINSESTYDSQLKLYAAIKNAEIARRNLDRIANAAQSGAIPKSRVIEIQNELEQLNVTIESYRQDLKARGLPQHCIERAEVGEFATEFIVRAPEDSSLLSDAILSPSNDPSAFSFEVHSLAVELGEQVAAGQLVAHLADHRLLLIEVRGFKEDLPAVQEAIKNGWEASVEFDLPAGGEWPPWPKSFLIHRMANSLDPKTRTFSFFLPLANQSQAYQSEGVTRLLWRFRPGTQLRVRVPVEKFEKVFVLPKQAVVWEGPEAYVFRQNGDFFDRLPVHVLCEDRLQTVLANDGSIKPSFYIAQSAAASLNRVLKAQASSGVPAGVHVHPDGTVHAAH